MLELTRQPGNVSQACSVMGYSRDSFYRFKELYERTGDAGCFACALGGADCRTLFLCTAPGFTEAEGMRGEGRILYTRVEVPAADY